MVLIVFNAIKKKKNILIFKHEKYMTIKVPKIE